MDNVITLDTEFKEFSEAQHRTINELSKRIVELEKERDELKKLLTTGMPLLVNERNNFLNGETISYSDEEIIARDQLKKINGRSQGSELTLDDARKVDVYSKILNNLKNAPKTIELKTKNMSDADLIKLLEKDAT